MAERFLKDGTFVRQFHLHIPLTLYERCRAIAKRQGYRYLSQWVVVILTAACDAVDGYEIPTRGEGTD